MTPIRTTQRDGSRTYRVRGEDLWSVTTIIGGGLPKPALLPWGIRTVAEFAVTESLLRGSKSLTARARRDPAEAIAHLKAAPYAQRDKAAGIGTQVHAATEAYVLGTPMPEPPSEVAPYLAAHRRFLDDWRPEFLMTEGTVCNWTERYAGTLDWIARLDGALVIGDTKTGKAVYPEVALQLAAYRYAEFVVLPNGTEAPLPAAERAVVLHLRPDGYSLVPVEAGEREYLCFRYVRECFRFLEEIAPTVLGEALAVLAASKNEGGQP